MKKKLWKCIVTVFTCSALMISVPVSAAEDENAQKVKEGSFAYFQDEGATEALDALNNSTYANLTVKGDANDATSFENMLASFQWIKECNRLRELNNLEPLLVNDTLMAMAQADANYSDTEIGHAQQFNVGENCAWNWGSNPFTQWYDEEKAVYDAMENPGWTNGTGHYLNIITSSYRTTGFAINTRGTKYPYTYVQVFSNDSNGITVDEYEKQLTEYYNSIKSNVNETPGEKPETTNPGTTDTEKPETTNPGTTDTEKPETGLPNITTEPQYTITSGTGSVWTKGSGRPLVIISNGDFSKFTGIAIDGEIVDSSNYDAVEGSTVVSLKSEYLESLNLGEHIYRVNYVDGAVETTFKIATPSSVEVTNTVTDSSPKTADSTDIMALLFVMSVAAGCVLLTLKARKNA